MAPLCFYCSSKREEGGKRRSRKRKVTSRKRHFFFSSINIAVMVLLSGRTANRTKPIKNYQSQKEWGKQVTVMGCWAPLWEQLEVRLQSTHRKASSHVQSKALDKKRFLRLKIDLTLGFSSEHPEQMKSSYINSSALWMPLELYTGARLTNYMEQMLCLPHPKTQLRNQTQRLTSKGWSTLNSKGSSTHRQNHPCKHLGSALGPRLCVLPAWVPGWDQLPRLGMNVKSPSCSKREPPCLSDCAPCAEVLSGGANVGSDYFSQRLLERQKSCNTIGCYLGLILVL